ncbi:MAG TPA: BON domain-containing protein [Pyrinomonadaceae bacterium]|jgi:osmotically-inducible protein OsmY|nr:BON domain-containing protein [Pyrinomonadaceae bacterium]
MNIRYQRRTLSVAALALFVALCAAACGGKDDNANNTNTGRNTNTATATPTPVMTTPTPVAASEDNALKNTVEANLTKAGVTGVTVEVKDGVVTLKGSVPAAKFADAVKAANDAKPKKVDNQLSKK